MLIKTLIKNDELGRSERENYFLIGCLKSVSCLQLLKKQPGGKAEALDIVLDALQRSGERAAEPFLKALVDPGSRQDALALIVDRERAEQLIAERG